MVKIDISKIADNETSLLPQFSTKTTSKTQLWNRVSRFPRKFLWPFLLLTLTLQAFVCWRIFVYEPQLPPSAPYNVTETVGLVTKWYELLQEMKYLGPDAIAYPPHIGENAINITLAQTLGLDPLVIETMQQLPYINPSSDGWMPSAHDILWKKGHFVDYRNTSDIWTSRDPLLRSQTSYSTKELPIEDALRDFDALPISALPLSVIRACGYTRYGLVLILDTASNSIIVQDTQGGGGHNDDPFFAQYAFDAMPRKYKIPGQFYGEEGLYAREASEVLTDFIGRMARLEGGFVPGSVRDDPHYTPELSPPLWESWVKDLFYESSWPTREILQDHLFGNNSDATIFESFRSSTTFGPKMEELQHNISVKYLPDRYCPVPREKSFIDKLAASGKLRGEQYKFAMSEEPVIPINLESWGGSLVFMQPEG